MGQIYGLFSGRDGAVRYVGQTVGTHAVRFKQHQRFHTGLAQVLQWIHSEWKAGYPVRSVCLEICNNEILSYAETKWISKFPNLLNERKKTYHLRRIKIKPPVIPEIKRYMARFVFNSGGLRGIHWWRELDRYSVFAYAPRRGGYWLPGDGAPGWTGDIWFTDRFDALQARDRDRESFRRVYKFEYWLPDMQEEV